MFEEQHALIEEFTLLTLDSNLLISSKELILESKDSASEGTELNEVRSTINNCLVLVMFPNKSDSVISREINAARTI